MEIGREIVIIGTLTILGIWLLPLFVLLHLGLQAFLLIYKATNSWMDASDWSAQTTSTK